MRTFRRAPGILVAAVLLAGGVARAEDAGDAAAAARRTADLVARLRSGDLDVRRQAVAEAKREQAPAVSAALPPLLRDVDEDVRIAAIGALAAREEAAARRDAATHLAGRLPRLTRNEQRDERLAVLRALHDLAQPSTLKALEEGVETDMEPEELALRLRAIANLPCDEAIERLIRFRAGGGRRGHAYAVRMAREAWAYATGQERPSNDPDAWRAWWGERKGSWDHGAALARRREKGGGPAARPEDGVPGGMGG